MQVHATGEYTPAIVADSDSLLRLWKHVGEYAGPASATVSCADGIERKFSGLDELLAYENSLRAAAQTIEIYGRARDPDRSVSITVGCRWGARATVSIRGEEQDVTAMRTRILDSFAGMRAWFSPVATLDLWIFWTIIFAAFWLIVETMAPSTPAARPGRSFSEALRQIGLGLSVIAPVFLLVYAVSKLRARYFPMVSMAFGQGAKRYQTHEQVRWAVIVAFVVGLAGSAVYGVMSGT